MARCIWESQCWVSWDSLAREEGEAFLPSLLELAHSSLSLIAQADVEMTDQKPLQHNPQLTRLFILVLRDNGFSVSLLHAVVNGLLKTVQYFWSPAL